MDMQPECPAAAPRLCVTTVFHFEAIWFADAAQVYTGIPMEVWRNHKGRWAYGPRED